MKVRCLEQIQKNGVTFRTGETYTASEINEHWYIVDAVGFETEDFNLHFEEQFTEADASAMAEQDPCCTNVVKMPLLDDPIVPGLSDERKDEEKKETFFDKVINYIFL